MPQDVRPSPLAGRWYPADAGKLRADLTRYLGTPTDSPHEKIRGLLSPHAGLLFWGEVGAKGYAHLAHHHYDYVVVIGPSHYPTDFPILTTGHDAYATSLGIVPIAKEILQQLGKQVTPIRNDPEHAIEMTLPFLQHILGEFQLIPLVMRDQRYETSQKLANTLVEILQGKNVLYVASSDLSHFYPQKIAHQLDSHTLNTMSSYRADSVIHLQDDGIVHACGYGAIAAVMLATGGQKAIQTAYGTSGDATGDYARVVGYGSMIFI